MRNFWLDKKRQNEETLSFAHQQNFRINEQSKAIFWNNRKANCYSKNSNLEYRKKGVDPNNDERLQGHGLESDPSPTSYFVVVEEGLAGDVEVLLKHYWRWQFPHNDALGVVRRLQRYIKNGHWHMIEDRIMGRANSVGRPITQEFSDKLKHYIIKLQTEEKTTLRQQTLYEKLVEQVQPAEYATLSDRFEHEAKNRPYTYNLVEDIILIKKYYRHLDGLTQLTKLTTEDVKIARVVERVQDHIQDGSWHYYQEYLTLKGYSKKWGDALRDCIANIPSGAGSPPLEEKNSEVVPSAGSK